MGTYFFIGKNTVENLNGRFEGKLSKEELTKLMDLLNSSRLEKVKNKPDNLFDTVDQSDKTLTIFFSNEKIDLLFNDVPLYLKRLVDYLYSSYKNVPLSKTSKKDIFDR
jgi:hypothetical protein